MRQGRGTRLPLPKPVPTPRRRVRPVGDAPLGFRWSRPSPIDSTSLTLAATRSRSAPMSVPLPCFESLFLRQPVGPRATHRQTDSPFPFHDSFREGRAATLRPGLWSKPPRHGPPRSAHAVGLPRRGKPVPLAPLLRLSPLPRPLGISPSGRTGPTPHTRAEPTPSQATHPWPNAEKRPTRSRSRRRHTDRIPRRPRCPSFPGPHSP
jgi:hypothetical protein